MNSEERARVLLLALDYHLPETRAEYDLDLAKAVALLTDWERETRLNEHRMHCHATLLQYDSKGKLTGNVRCGEGWECERRKELEARPVATDESIEDATNPVRDPNSVPDPGSESYDDMPNSPAADLE